MQKILWSALQEVFSADENGFTICPKTGQVLGPKGYKNVYEINKDNPRETITVLVADGRPQCIAYPYVKPPRVIAENILQEWI